MNISRDKFCKPLKLEHLCLQERLPMKSVVFITEVGRIASQYNWQNLNVQTHVTEFFANYRHYTQGGYVFMDDQSISSVAKVIRVRLGSALDMLHFRKFWKIYWNRMRNIFITEDIVMVEDANKEGSMKWHIWLFPLFDKNYETYFMF